MNYTITDSSMKAKMERWLRANDNCYSFNDIMVGIEKGQFQTHLFGDTWALTSIHDWPQRRSVHIDLVVGHLQESLKVEPEVCSWAKSIGADLITGSGRPGWDPLRALVQDWRMTGFTYSKDLRNG